MYPACSHKAKILNQTIQTPVKVSLCEVDNGLHPKDMICAALKV